MMAMLTFIRGHRHLTQLPGLHTSAVWREGWLTGSTVTHWSQKSGSSCQHHSTSSDHAVLTSSVAPPGGAIGGEDATGEVQQNLFFLKLLNVRDPSTVLQIAKKEMETASDARQILQKLSALYESEAERRRADFVLAVRQDRAFKKTCFLLHDNPSSLSTEILLDSLECLLKLLANTHGNSYVLESLEAEVVSRAKDMSLKELIRLVRVHRDFLLTDLHKTVYNHALTMLHKQVMVSKVLPPKDILLLVTLLEGGPNDLLEKLETQLIESESEDMKHLYNLLYLVGKQRRRNLKTLYPLSKKLCACPVQQLGLRKLVNVAFACANLTFYDPALLGAVSAAVVALLKEDSGFGEESESHAVSLLHSVSTVRWRDVALLDALAQQLVDNLDKVSHTALLALVKTCSTLNYLPPPLQHRYAEVLEMLRIAGMVNPMLWMDVVWSTAVLEQANESLLSSVLHQGFLTRLDKPEKGLIQTATWKVKLVNIDAIAACEVTDYTGPRLPQDFVQKYQVVVPQRNERDVLQTVITALNDMAPTDKYQRHDVSTPYGYNIDIEMLVNERGQPQPVMEYESLLKQDNQTSSLKPVPPNFHRLALKVMDFPDHTLCSVGPTGVHAMAFRYLRHLGYTVIQIPHQLFMQRKATARQVQYLQRKINFAISPEVTAADQSSRNEPSNPVS